MDTQTKELRQRVLNAVRQCLGGDVRAGISAFEASMSDPRAQKLPVAVQIDMLASQRPDAAQQLRRAALRSGLDLNSQRFMPGVAPARLVDSYRRLFAEGWANSTMCSNYLVALSALGESDEVARHFDGTISIERDFGERFGVDLTAIHEEITAAVAPENWHERRLSIVRSHRVDLSQSAIGGSVQTLLGVLSERVGRYGASPAWGPESLVAHTRPAAWRLQAWAVVSDGPGHTTRHLHDRGWLSGVFYVVAPGMNAADPDAGCLFIGRPAEVADAAPGWPTLRIEPIPGTLVVMPSYAAHWTAPVAGLRIAVAFDAIPAL